jgi:bifunctional enzyme CysN/CysC
MARDQRELGGEPVDTRSLLRFITCGSVDDGKSTLIGRLLYDTGALLDDQLDTLEKDSRAVGTQGADLDFALLVDGLQAEREQGITIDVAYRFFSTEGRRFIVADTPGHEQYTRNMITGASTADLAVILIDARKGVLTQTRRHSRLVSLVGIRRVVLAVNKIDLVGYDQAVFDRIVHDYRAFAASLGFEEIAAIPVSGLKGDNVIGRSTDTPWYDGPSLLEHLEAAPVLSSAGADRPFRFPVQWVNRPNADFRGFSGTIASGAIAVGDKTRVLPGEREAVVQRIVTSDGDLPSAETGDAVTLVLDREIDVSRGDMLVGEVNPAIVADRLHADLAWMDEAALDPAKSYLIKLGTQTAGARIVTPVMVVDIETGLTAPAPNLALNGIGSAEIAIDRPIAFDPYLENRDTGGFILIDRLTNATAAAGMVRGAVRKSSDVQWQELDVSASARASMKGQRAAVVWFTGLSGAGKSTIANLLERRLHHGGFHTYLLDGDNLRHGLNGDLGFSPADRVENVRRAAEAARLMAEAGLIVLVSLISPYRTDRSLARGLLPPGDFIEVHVDTPLEIAEQRDVKGLYRRARAGEIKDFTGVSSPYEPPETPEIRVDTAAMSAQTAAETIYQMLQERGVLAPTYSTFDYTI